MSEAPNRDLEMLARVAELDLLAVEKAHARLMAAEDAAEIGELGRTYARITRSLRQTLALKAKLSREADQDARWAKTAKFAAPPAFLFAEADVEDRVGELQDAVDRVVAAAVPDEGERERLHDRFDRELDDWTLEDDFTTANLDAQVRRACEILGLPADLAATWRALPPPTLWPDPAEDDLEPVYAPPTSRRDTG